MSLLKPFKVKSRISGSYNVFFINKLSELSKVYTNTNTIYITDNKVSNLYENEFNFINSESRIVEIDCSEKTPPNC